MHAYHHTWTNPPADMKIDGPFPSEGLEDIAWFDAWFSDKKCTDLAKLQDAWTQLIIPVLQSWQVKRSLPLMPDDKLLSGAKLLNKYLGCFVGLAVGDALGAPVEFLQRGTFQVKSMSDVEGKLRWRHGFGMYTDDTCLALCMAYSLLKKGEFDLRHQADTFAYWLESGIFSPTKYCLGIGRTTKTALKAYCRTLNPRSGLTNETSCGNGSLMRLAPIPLFFLNRGPAMCARMGGLSSIITHRHTVPQDACRYFSQLLYAALNFASKEEVLRTDIWLSDQPSAPTWFDKTYWVENPLVDSVAQIAQGSYKQKRMAEISSSGYVLHSLEAALYCFYHTNNFADGALMAVNLGEDTDTIGAIYGQLAGAFYGEIQIPYEWLEKLINYRHFYQWAQHLFIASDFYEQRLLG